MGRLSAASPRASLRVESLESRETPAAFAPVRVLVNYPAPIQPSAAAAAQTLRISYANGQVGGDTGTVPVALGTPLRLEITSDTAEEAHLHGYDEAVQVPAGGTATIELTADIPGEFELELHHSGAALALPPDAAKDRAALQQVRASAVASLDEMRSMILLLRSEGRRDDGAVSSPSRAPPAPP